LHVAAALNELPRQVVRAYFTFASRLVPWVIRRRIASHPREQRRLRRAYGVQPRTPILPWGPELEAAVEAFAASNPQARFAYTSGSTNRPKKIAFTPRRLAQIKRASLEAAVQAGRAHRVLRPTLFVLAALREDDSLSTLVLDEGRATSYSDGLVMPSRYLWEPELRGVLEAHGSTATRLWLLLLSNPGIVYSTNPSTLAVFLGKLEDEWESARSLAQAWARDPRSFDEGAARVARRVVAPGWARRLRLAAESSQPPPLHALFPGLAAYCCWDGGYVVPFLDRIRASLPPPRFGHIPMYSMSTETLETQAYYERGRTHFLPISPGVLYEFLPEGAEDDPLALLPARALQPGANYSMVVSDPYGLTRYATGDVFACVDRVREVPDLRFLRRRGLAYSFTGEKLTGEQVEAAFARLPKEAGLPSGVQLTLIPALGAEGDLPHYRLVLAHSSTRPPATEVDPGPCLDRLLSTQNREFAGKLASGRLGPTRAVTLAYDDFAQLLSGASGGGESERSWETQFKLVPLYTRRWAELGLPPEVGAQ
jgi:hypothetical protein